jgi:hypothetical protein
MSDQKYLGKKFGQKNYIFDEQVQTFFSCHCLSKTNSYICGIYSCIINYKKSRNDVKYVR